MWKKDDARAAEVYPATKAKEISSNLSPLNSSNNRSAVPPLANTSRPVASLGKGISIVGDVTGTEDLFLDGTVEGNLDFKDCTLTIGPNGNVRADVIAREVILQGKLDGRVMGSSRVAIADTGVMAGDVKTDKLSIEEGGILRGKVETGKPAPVVQPEMPKEDAPEPTLQIIEVSTESVTE